MTEDIPRTDKKRCPWLAVILSMLMPGIGHVYCGRLSRGLILGLLYGLGIPVVLGTLAYFGPTSSVFFGFGMIAATFGVVLAAMIDSYRLAARTRKDYALKVFNHPAIYLVLGLMIQGSCLGYTLHVRSSLFEAFRVSAASMYPTIAPNDRILVDKCAYKVEIPKAGDIVLFHPPTDQWRVNWIKRIVAVAGETVAIENGIVYIDGQPLVRRRVGPGRTTLMGQNASKTIEGEIYTETNGGVTYDVFVTEDPNGAHTNMDEITVPPHHCFLLGDNRDYSLDSRQFGPAPLATIVGRADYLYWPVDTWARFGRLDR